MPKDEADKRIGSVGKPNPPMEVRVVDPDTDEDRPPMEVGELLVRLPGKQREYYKDDGANASSWTADGWLRTGDLAYLDADGFVRDPWGSEQNRIRYAVFGAGASVNGVVNPLTRSDGMRAATLAGLGAAPHFLFICSTGIAASPSGCGPAVNQLTRRAAFVLLSLGADAPNAPDAGSDEARNLAGNPVFISHEAAATPGNAFDDLVAWMPVHLMAHRLVVAGRLP